MASYSGTVLSAPVVVGTDLDKFPTHKSEFGKGGWHEVADTTERDAIPAERRTAGMAVFVTGTSKLYTLNADLTTWTEFEAGSSSGAAWGEITGTLSNQTDLSSALGSKLEASNLIQGSNITLTKNGNNITIAASGQISSTVNWGDIQGGIGAQLDVDNKFRNIDATVQTLKEFIADGEDYITPYLATGTSKMTYGVNQWYAASTLTPGEGGGYLTALVSSNERSTEEDTIIHLAIITVDTANQTMTCTRRLPNINFKTGTEYVFDEPIWLAENEYLMFGQESQPVDAEWHYSSSDNVQCYLFNTWKQAGATTDPVAGQTCAWNYGSYPRLSSSLGAKFKKLTISTEAFIPAIQEAVDTYVGPILDEKTNQSDFLPIENMFKLKYTGNVFDDDHNPGMLTRTWGKGTGTSNPWINTYYVMWHSGYIDKLTIYGVGAEPAVTDITIQLAAIEVNEESGETPTWTRASDVVTASGTITPSGTTELILDTPLWVEAGQYIGMKGKLPWTSLTASTNFADFTTTLSGTWNPSRKETPCGINFSFYYYDYYNPAEEIQGVYSRVEALEDINESLPFELGNEVQITHKDQSAPRPASPGNIYWLDMRDIFPAGIITRINFGTVLSTTDPVTFRIGGFEVTGSVADRTQRAVLVNCSKIYTLPANTSEIYLGKDGFEVHAGETVGVVFGGSYMKYSDRGAAGNNCITGGSIITEVGEVLTGYYAGAFSQLFNYYMTDPKTIAEKFDDVDTKVDELEDALADVFTRTSKEDMVKVMLVGSSLTEASYCPHNTTWPERINDMVDVNIINTGWSGCNVATNTNRLATNGNMRFAPTVPSRSIKPTYIMWDDSANGTPTGLNAMRQYRQMKQVVDSYGAKLLMGSEENYAGQYSAYEHTQQAFANEVGVPYSAVTRLNQMAYPRNNTAVCPYPVNGSSHAGYRANVSYLSHAELLNSLPIYKNVKVFAPRTTYKGGNPTAADLAYDTNEQRMWFFTAKGPGAIGNATPGHIDNLDNSSYDVTGTTDPGSSESFTSDLWLGTGITFNKFALVEFIIEKTGITKGTFQAILSSQPTKAYIMTTYNETTGPNGTYNAPPYEDDYIRSSWVELTNTSYEASVFTASFENDTLHQYELYDKVKILLQYDGGNFTLSYPEFKNYDGENKCYDDTIHYKQRQFGTELLTSNNPSSWTKGGTAKEGTLPAPVANYTLYNSTLKHVELLADGDSVTRTEQLSVPKYRKVAVRIVAQMWQKISTTRYNDTEWAEYTDYITNTASDPLGVAAYVPSDYDYGRIRVQIGNYITKDLVVYPGWFESYFEADLTPEDTSIVVTITKLSHIDDSYNNDDKPIFIHHVSVQDLSASTSGGSSGDALVITDYTV